MEHNVSITDFKIQLYMENRTCWLILITSLDSSTIFTSAFMYNSTYDILEIVRSQLLSG